MVGLYDEARDIAIAKLESIYRPLDDDAKEAFHIANGLYTQHPGAVFLAGLIIGAGAIIAIVVHWGL